jgi:hypothetical protein
VATTVKLANFPAGWQVTWTQTESNQNLYSLLDRLTGSLTMMIMSIRWDYVSKLQSPTGLLFIPEVIYEHWAPWWNDIDRERLLIRPPQLSGNPTSSHLVSSQEEVWRRKWWIWPSNCLCSYSKWILLSVKRSDIGQTNLLPLRCKACFGFLSPLKFITSAGFDPANLGSNGKHANHYTTEATFISVTWSSKWSLLFVTELLITNYIQQNCRGAMLARVEQEPVASCCVNIIEFHSSQGFLFN